MLFFGLQSAHKFDEPNHKRTARIRLKFNQQIVLELTRIKCWDCFIYFMPSPQRFSQIAFSAGFSVKNSPALASD